jgi:excisionase family DNA binding protein
MGGSRASGRTMNLPEHKTTAAAVPLTDRLALSVPNASAMLGISRATLYREILAGRLRKTRGGGRTLIAMEDARAWLAACRAQGAV